MHDLSSPLVEESSSMTACPSTTRTVLTRTGALAVVFGAAFGLVLGPAGLALAQDVPFSTVRAVIDEDGSVESVERLGSDEAPGDLPVTVTIAEAGGTTSYTVENTTVEKQTISYLGAEGKPTTSEVDVALPLVAQLSVLLPDSRKEISATGARVTKLADGSTELVWSMVLFGPIGSPVQDVSFSSSGSGDPVARLAVQAVQPNATPGLSAVGQAANATVNGNGILSTVANGADNGLGQLSDGVSQLLAGLDKLYAGAQQLNSGIVDAVDGAEQLADGSEAAKAGSGELSTGLDQLAAGNGSAADGADKLSDGLALISGGLGQLSAAQGLPAALDGAKKLQVGVDALRAGMGSPTTDGTILNGLAQVAGGLAQVDGGLDGLGAGLPQARGGVDQVQAGLAAAVAAGGPADQLLALLGVVRMGLPGCAPGAPVAAPATPCEALNTAVFAVSHPVGALGATDTGGVKQQLTAAAAGLSQVSTGLGAAVAGVGQLSAGVTALQAGVAKLDAGSKQIAAGLESGDPTKPGIAEGLDALVAGLTTAVGGVSQLAAGAKEASTGSVTLADGTRQLADGATKAATGAKELDAGLAKIADGQRKVADGLPAAADGSGQIADGLDQAADGGQKVKQGLSDVRTQAVGVLKSQFAQGTELARLQLAGLDAASARIADTAGAATTTWVLTQGDDGSISADLASGDSDLGRNAAIGVGGALLLLGGIAGGYLSGRRKSAV